MGKVYQVYRVDNLTKLKIPIGTVTERRSRARDIGSQLGLMKLARQMFGQSAEDQFRIVVGEEQTA
ncbi:MAG: hypothetical protein WBM29_02785 [Candidatus Deferrimicrobium sp.]